MGLILGSIAAAAVALRALWMKVMREDVARALMTARQIKLGTNLLIVCAQAAGYIAELLSGTRTTLPSTGSSTMSMDSQGSSPMAAKFNSRTADSVGA